MLNGLDVGQLQESHSRIGDTSVVTKRGDISAHGYCRGQRKTKDTAIAICESPLPHLNFAPPSKLLELFLELVADMLNFG